MDQFIQSFESADPSACSNEAERTGVVDALFAAMRRFQQPYGRGFYYDVLAPTLQNLPAFLAETGYQHPAAASEGDQQRHGVPIQVPPAPLGRHLPHRDRGRGRAAARPGRAMVVDVGGGNGHGLEKFRLRHHQSWNDDDTTLSTGALVLQERPDVAEKLKDLDPAIAVQAHDFFTPQPVWGARVYLLHNILHDWTEENAIRILAKIVGAMEKGDYSRLLIHEYVFSPRQSHTWVTTHDLKMMASFSGKERAEAEFVELVSSVRKGGDSGPTPITF
ncbi:hypothetical protein PG994_012496 [Apiospora phragmitis]|uniref:O-methyltransferase C-terminal domain-containing protein n=1 Tax=Apiospora phragmitis TaxID=2905665 RepID=A0ABR1TY28_9PEZI